ncbi:hypothetical protein [Leptolyngbya sp. FACHB-321]|uniref:hypothetical protein n=1 Tax=Leptolyngbya sp. FACHB-321 TaxID=2692807 RepID=UPI0018EF5639|nr:hypothetical protein [Leptolyngbya sp. FACHB-321]
MLQSYLEETLLLAATGSEKVRSEGLIYPLLVEVRRYLKRQSGCILRRRLHGRRNTRLEWTGGLLAWSFPPVSTLEVPATVIVEAKKADLATGLGQCVAEIVAAQLFNQLNGKAIPVVYGVVSNDTQWRFLNLQDRTVTLDLVGYPLPPIDQLLEFLVWIMQEG